MINVKKGMASKLENAFLEILRIVILIVLAVSLVAAVALGIYGVKNLSASEHIYQYNNIDNKALINELKKSLESNPAPSQPASVTQKSSLIKSENKLLDEELNTQIKIASDFLGRFDKHLTSPDVLRANLRKMAMTLALAPTDEVSVLEYAKGQSEFLQLAFTDQSIHDALRKKSDDASLSNYFSAALDAYPDYFEKQKERRSAFDSQERIRVSGAKSGAMMELYIASGLFLVFLLISLLLVLVKMERNLRALPIDG